MTFRLATLDDCALLAGFNQQLIQDERHRNRMTVPELEQRMRCWLAGEYCGVIYEDNGEVVAYALFRERPADIYLRQLFVVRDRRRQGLGRRAVEILRSQVWPKTKRLTVDVLVTNESAVTFWRSIGYTDYCLTLEMLPMSSTCGDSDSGMNAQGLLEEYIKAYNAKDVTRMIGLFAEACVFENISSGKVTVRTEGKADLEALARRSSEAFASREQKVISLTEGQERIVAEIEYHAVLQADLSPDLTAGSEIKLRGISVFEFSDGKIVRLSDYS
jgi:steroid delta-isomerase-like uncharacterized protein